MTRWLGPGGWKVEEITLRDTPEPSRPGDPPRHRGPRTYLRADRGRGMVWHCASEAELVELAEAQAWSIADLQQVPTHVVIGAADGTVRGHDDRGQPFGLREASRWASGREGHRVYVLAEVDAERVEAEARPHLELVS